ncbi:MAG: ABC transporter ATP-binding protein [Spirochaetaceae bacterium]|jgi:ABC-2 type transport system ATP-binding protein|nr:ABC transporter ATP-binding protein [Spirochaetaceae bacterium]
MVNVQNVTKIYGARRVVDNISFSLGDRGILGFLGPNGAGKSTTMNIIAGYTSSSAGTVTVNGSEILEDPIGAKRNVGYLPERPPLYPDMTVSAYLSFIFDLKKLPLPKKPHINEICEAVGIGPVQKRILKNLSKGFQQRVGLAQAMLGNPGLLIMDEPTVGLDPVQILEIRGLIRDLGKKSAVIFSSHILQEVQAVCDRVIVINNGVLIADDSLENLSRLGDNRIFLSVEGPGEELLPQIRALPGLKSVSLLDQADEEGAAFEIESETGCDPRRDLFNLLAAAGRPILSLRKNRVSLEDAFIRLTAGDNAALSAIAGTAAPLPEAGETAAPENASEEPVPAESFSDESAPVEGAEPGPDSGGPGPAAGGDAPEEPDTAGEGEER